MRGTRRGHFECPRNRKPLISQGFCVLVPRRGLDTTLHLLRLLLVGSLEVKWAGLNMDTGWAHNLAQP